MPAGQEPCNGAQFYLVPDNRVIYSPAPYEPVTEEEPTTNDQTPVTGGIVSISPTRGGSLYDPKFIRGDLNYMSGIDFRDSQMLTEFIVGQRTSLPCMDAADVNDDGFVNLSDSTFLIGYIAGVMLATIPAPFPSCGTDQTDDDLDCEVSTCWR